MAYHREQKELFERTGKVENKQRAEKEMIQQCTISNISPMSRQPVSDFGCTLPSCYVLVTPDRFHSSLYRIGNACVRVYWAAKWTFGIKIMRRNMGLSKTSENIMYRAWKNEMNETVLRKMGAGILYKIYKRKKLKIFNVDDERKNWKRKRHW